VRTALELSKVELLMREPERKKLGPKKGKKRWGGAPMTTPEALIGVSLCSLTCAVLRPLVFAWERSWRVQLTDVLRIALTWATLGAVLGIACVAVDGLLRAVHIF